MAPDTLSSCTFACEGGLRPVDGAPDTREGITTKKSGPLAWHATDFLTTERLEDARRKKIK